MKQKTLAKIAFAGAVVVLLMGSSVAFAQTYDYGINGAASGSAGTIVPGGNMNTTGITDPNGVGATGAVSGTVTTPGVPNTGIGETAMATLAITGAVALAAGYLALRRNQGASLA